MADRIAILVTGSRAWRDYKPIRERLALYPKGSILLHGDCGRYVESDDIAVTAPVLVGADWIAADIARSFGFVIWPLPYFADLGKRGGPERNTVLVNVLEQLWRGGFTCFVEAFPIGESRGTRDCLFKARRASETLRLGVDNVWSICVTEGANG